MHSPVRLLKAARPRPTNSRVQEVSMASKSKTYASGDNVAYSAA